MTKAATKRWYLGAVSDGVFIIDRPPSPAPNDDAPNTMKPMPDVVISVSALPASVREEIVREHNAALEAAGRAQTGDPDMPDLTLCSFDYLADEMRRRGATVTPAPHSGDFADDPQAPKVSPFDRKLVPAAEFDALYREARELCEYGPDEARRERLRAAGLAFAKAVATSHGMSMVGHGVEDERFVVFGPAEDIDRLQRFIVRHAGAQGQRPDPYQVRGKNFVDSVLAGQRRQVGGEPGLDDRLREYAFWRQEVAETAGDALLVTDLLEASRAVRTAAPVVEVSLEVGYTNYRGEYSVRSIIPRKLWFGSTPWHPQQQWFLHALDVNKGELRDLAIRDFRKPEIAA